MAIPPRSVETSNIPIDVSKRYAEAQNLPKLPLEEAAAISKTAQESVSIAQPTELNRLWGGNLAQSSTYAEFDIPADLNLKKSNLFSTEVAPRLRLGSTEQVDAKIDLVKNHSVHSPPTLTEDEVVEWEEKVDVEENIKNKDAILNVIKCIHTLNRDILDFNSNKLQYLKG
jgi:hypothetical protein